MILQLRKLQLCLNGSELASYRLEYYKTFHQLFEYPPRRLHQLYDLQEDVESLEEEYQDLFIRPNERYVYPFGSIHKKGKVPARQLKQILIEKTAGHRPTDDHLLHGLGYMCSLIKGEKRQWQRKNCLLAMGFLSEEQHYLLNYLDWLPDLCSLIGKNATSCLYREVALNLTNFFHFEEILLEKILLESSSLLN